MTNNSQHTAASGNLLPALDDLTVLAVSGADAQTFLQNQLTNDVRRVTPDRAQLSGWCTAKGRLLALFLIWQQADGYRLLLPGAVADAVRKRLAMFVLRAKVNIDVLDSAAIRVMGGCGPRAEALLGQWAGRVPAQPHDVVARADGVVIRLPAGRLIAAMPSTDAANLLAAAATNGLSAARADWEVRCIQAGEPQISAATQEEFVPQQVNLDLIDGVSFKKGCYPGQEIVARTHYLGRIKRRMFRLRAAAGTAPLPGDDLFLPADGGTSPAGKVVRACATADSVELLAVLQLAGDEELRPAEHYLLADGRAAHLTDLPYPVLAT